MSTKIMRRILMRFFVVSLCVACLGLLWLWERPDQSLSASQLPNPSPPCHGCRESSEQIIYAPVFDLPEASDSEIVFNCRSPQVMEVTPTFYTAEGVPIIGQRVQLQPAEIRFVPVESLIPEEHRGRHRWGGIALSYAGRLLEVWAQLRLLSVGRGGSVDVLFSVLRDRRSNVSQAVWWMPLGATAVIALGNISDVPIRATLQFSDDSTQEVVISPFATEFVRYRGRRSSGNAQRRYGTGEAVTITSIGPEGGLITTGLVTSPRNRFSNIIRFYDTANAVQPNLFATNFQASAAESRLVLKNTTDSPITARPRFLPIAGEAGNPVELPAVTVRPQEIREVDLQPLRAAATHRTDLDSVSVQITNSGAPGSLIGALHAISPAGAPLDAPLRDTGSLRSTTGSYPWRIDDDYSTIVTVTNVGDELTDFVIQIHYEGGKYAVGPLRLAGGESAIFDLKKLRDERVPDATGRIIPASVTGGQFRWSIRNGSSRLIGRSQIVSATHRVSSSYSCPLPCGSNYDYGYLEAIYDWDFVGDPSSLGIGLNESGTGYMAAYEMRKDVYGGVWGPYDNTSNATWTTRNSGIVSVISHGYFQGVSEGETFADAIWSTTEWYELNGECGLRNVYAETFAVVRAGLIARDAYEFLSETNTGGRYGYGVCDWSPTCIGRCTVTNLSGDKVEPGPCPAPYLQCRSLYVNGVCYDSITRFCRGQNVQGSCD